MFLCRCCCCCLSPRSFSSPHFVHFLLLFLPITPSLPHECMLSFSFLRPSSIPPSSSPGCHSALLPVGLPGHPAEGVGLHRLLHLHITPAGDTPALTAAPLRYTHTHTHLLPPPGSAADCFYFENQETYPVLLFKSDFCFLFRFKVFTTATTS